MTSIDELLRQLKLGGAHEALKSQRVQMTHYHEGISINCTLFGRLASRVEF